MMYVTDPEPEISPGTIIKYNTAIYQRGNGFDTETGETIVDLEIKM